MVAAKKSQEESEQPAKVYQLDAIVDQVNGLAVQMEKGFIKVDTSINALLVKSESQVSPQQLENTVTAARSTLENQISEEVEKIHLAYSPLKENNKWLIRAIASQGIIILGQALYFLYVTRSTG